MHKLLYKLTTIFIFLAHIALLYWMFYALQNGGVMDSQTLLLHFCGMAIFGAALIIFSAKMIKYFHLNELKKNRTLK